MNSSNPRAPLIKKSDAPPPYGQAPVMGVPVKTYQPQATPFQVQSSAPVTWSTGLFDCFDDVENCCTTLWCPCITFGQVAEIVDEGTTSCGASGALYALIAWSIGPGVSLYSCYYRSKLRQQHSLEESCGGEFWGCMVHLFCEPCALCQEYRELKHQGFNPSIGWQGNEKQRTQGMMTATAPVIQGGMNR